MSDLDVLGLVSSATAQGPDIAADAGLVVTCPVYAVDATERMVQVGVRGSAMWLRAVAGRYRARLATPGLATSGGLARVLLNATTGRPELVLGPVNPADTAVLGTVSATGTGTVTVTIDGASSALPAIPSTYTVGQTAWVLLSDWGAPLLVLGPSALTEPTTDTPTAPPAPTSVTVTGQAVSPQWSGSYRATRAAWDRWNVTRYGGRSTLYQGNGYGSGPMTGLATYGNQLVNLGATTITRVQVRLVGVGLSGAAGPATVQGSPHASQPAGAPSSSGDTATGDGWVDLPASVCEAMRTGSVKGLCTVGANYWGIAGAGNGDGMVLRVDYTRPA